MMATQPSLHKFETSPHRKEVKYFYFSFKIYSFTFSFDEEFRFVLIQAFKSET